MEGSAALGRQTVAARRGAGPATPAGAPSPGSTLEPSALAVTASRVLRVDEGLYVLRLGGLAGRGGEVAGMRLPAAQIAVPFGEDAGGVSLVAAFPGRGPWFGHDGGSAILRSPPGGGFVMVTAYGMPDATPTELSIELRRLDDAVQGEAVRPAPAPRTGRTRDIGTEILLHIERTGDGIFPGRGWVGALGRRMRVEAFSIRPLEGLAPAEIEMKAFLPNRAETDWVPGGTLCGTRGRGLPLTGFALRVAPRLAGRFDVLYQGSFFAGGISGVSRNGEPCRSTAADDPLEAVNVRLIEHLGGDDGAL